MKRNRNLILFVALVLCILVVSALLVPSRQSSVVSAAEDKPKGKLTKVFRKDKSNKNDLLPDWVDQAFKKGKGHLKQGGREWSKQLIDVESELDVQTAEEDDLGETRVRVGQVFNGVPVIGGQLIIHEDANGVRETDGRGFSAARHVDTKPTLKQKDAVDAAKNALGFNGNFANEPEANLVILPNEMIDPKSRIGANLVYVVEFLIEDGTNATGRHFYYVDANDGHVVWHYNALTEIDSTGNSFYSGTVTLASRQVNSQYWLQDPTRGSNGNADANTSDSSLDQSTQDTLKQGGNWTTDINNLCDGSSNPNCNIDRTLAQKVGTIFTNGTNVWGDSTSNSRQTAAADAHFAAMKTWDYYANTYQRNGIDGNNYRMLIRVHYGTANNFVNGFWNGKSVAVGDGNGSTRTPLVSLDAVAHEYTHGFFEKAIGVNDTTQPLIFSGETAALNESLADIFGTAVEFYVREQQCIPCQPDSNTPYRTCQQQAGGGYCLTGNYLLGEDFTHGGAAPLRSMEDPWGFNNFQHPDHTDRIDLNTDPHAVGGVQSKAFWLLAQTGTNTHLYSGIAVTGIGRAKAEYIFYHALADHLGYNGRLFDHMRAATLSAACADPQFGGYGSSSQECISTGRAWDAVGVPPNEIDLTDFFVRQQYLDFLSRAADQSGYDFWVGNINNCTPKPSCIDTQRVNTSAAYFLSIEFQNTGYFVERMYKAAYGDASGTSTLGGSHTLAVPVVRRSDWLPDSRTVANGVIVGQTGWETQLENNKQAFALAFVQRSRFTSAFPTSRTPTQFVDALNANAGNVLSSDDRTTAINLFSGASDTSNITARAQAIRQVTDNQNLSSAESNRAFVLMQYFGYLRRDPNSGQDVDYTGYDFWLQKLIQYNGNYNQAEMVKAFITSIEYRQRFGQV